MSDAERIEACVMADRVITGSQSKRGWQKAARDVARAFKDDQETIRSVILRCRYILVTCRGEDEMMAEAREILRLFGEAP